MTELIKSIITPSVQMFLILLIGYLLGQIRFKGISLDIAGVLIVAVIAGIFIKHFRISYSQECLQLLSSLGIALFMSAISLQVGYGIGRQNRQSIGAMIFGGTIVLINFMFMKLMSTFDDHISFSELAGIFCGSMTSSPGLASLSNDMYIDLCCATIGYSTSYLIGVISVVSTVQIMCKNTPSITIESTSLQNETNRSRARIHGLIQISIIVIVGSVVGSFHIPLINTSLGATGGILISGLLFGVCVNKKKPLYIVSNENISVFRTVGMIMFFVGNGIISGINITSGISIKTMIYSLILSTTPIIISIYISRRVMHLDTLESAYFISGVMTSTPAMGVLLSRRNTSNDLSLYSMTYMGAMCTIVVIMSIV